MCDQVRVSWGRFGSSAQVVEEHPFFYYFMNTMWILERFLLGDSLVCKSTRACGGTDMQPGMHFQNRQVPLVGFGRKEMVTPV